MLLVVNRASRFLLASSQILSVSMCDSRTADARLHGKHEQEACLLKYVLAAVAFVLYPVFGCLRKSTEAEGPLTRQRDTYLKCAHSPHMRTASQWYGEVSVTSYPYVVLCAP